MLWRTEVEVNDGVALVVRGDTMLTLWNAPARLHRSRWVFDRLDALAQAYGNVQGLMVLLPNAEPPDSATRAENLLRLRRLSGALRRVVTVVDGDELHQLLVRTVLRLLAIPLGRNRIVVELDVLPGLMRLRESARDATPTEFELRAAAVALYAALSLRAPDSLPDFRERPN